MTFITRNGLDWRFDDEQQTGHAAETPFSDVITNEECAWAGLPPNPLDLHEDDVWPLAPEYIEGLLATCGPDDEDYKAKLLKELEISIPFHERVAAWRAKFNAYLEVPKSKVFLALREGTLPCRGKLLSAPTLQQSLKLLKDTGWEEWNALPVHDIDKAFWRWDGINWDASGAQGETRYYAHIHCAVPDLLSAFPPPAGEPVYSVVRIANDFVLIHDTATAPLPEKKRGRPPLDWDGFHLEMARRVRADQLPAKQEALIAEMQEWFKSNWAIDVGRSTLLQKIKPYYDAFLRVGRSKKRA